MKKIKRALLWFSLLEKRLFKKPGYVVLLAAVPVIALIMSLIASRSDGIIKVALYCADRTDTVAVSIYDDLITDSGLVGFREAGSREEAEALVRYGAVDTSWVIEGDILEKLYDYVSGRDPEGPVFSIFVREDKPMLLIAREKLSGKIAPYMMREAMKRYIRTDLRDLGEEDEEALNAYYAGAYGKEDILGISYTEKSGASEINYIVIPARGMLAVMTVLCGLAAAMYCRRDVDANVIRPLRGPASLIAECGYILTGVIPAAIVSAASLLAAGVLSDPLREAAALAAFCLCTAVFCTLIMRLIPSGRILAVITPLVVIALIGISPIFFDLGSLKALQMTTPTYHYLMASYNASYLISSVIYAFAVAALCEAVRLTRLLFSKVTARNN